MMVVTILGACGDDAADTNSANEGSGTGTQTSANDSSSTTDDETTGMSGTSADGSSGSSVDTTGGSTETGESSTSTGDPKGLLDCDMLCGPYQDCDESVYLTCLSNCQDIVPPLHAYDVGCGEAAATYFECRFTLSCEDAIAVQNDGPDLCEPLLDPYLNTCLDVVPATCDGFCDSLLACFEQPDTPENVDGCQFECLLYEGYAALTDTPACDSATDALLGCVTAAKCQDMEFVGCDDAEVEWAESCESPSGA